MRHLVCVLLFCTLICVVRSADRTIKNAQNEVEFILRNDSWIEVPNHHRDGQPHVRFFPSGFTFESIKDKGAGLWHLGLSDGSSMHFHSKRLVNSTFSEYYLMWPSFGSAREICFDYGVNNASWFNTYLQANPAIPIDNKQTMTKQAVNGLDHLILEHLFLNSDGFALMLDQFAPLFLRYDHFQGSPILCFSTNNESPYLTSDHDAEYKDIRFNLFAAENIRAVYELVAIEMNYIEKPKSIPDEDMFRYPNWLQVDGTWNHFKNIENCTQNSVMSFVDDLQKHGYTNGVVNLDHFWQGNWLTFDSARYPDPKSMATELHRRGYKLTLYIHPEDDNYLKYPQQYFVKNETDQSQNLLDFTNQKAVEWFAGMLKKLQEYGVDGFQFSTMISGNYKFYDNYTQKYPSLAIEKYVRIAEQFSNLSLVREGYKTQDMANFVRFPDTSADWANLRSLIPVAITLSLAGYSFIVPDLIGGRNGRSSEELYIRWVQATTFMPSMQFMIPPWDYNDNVVRLTRKFVNLHAQYAPMILELAKERVTRGAPIIRPMWYVAPDDPKAYTIDSQFMLGDLLVAPVLEAGQTQREVYLPEGVWFDQRGQHYDGPNHIIVQAPLGDLPYFKRHL